LLRLGKPLSFVPSRGYIDNKQHKHMWMSRCLQ
jgi:hypothetical protein